MEEKTMSNMIEIPEEFGTILVVEDDEGLLHLVRKHLGRKGLHTEGRESGEGALEQIGSQRPALLLLDYRLPDMTADHFVKLLKEKEYEVPFIVMTGYADIREAVDMMKLGARDYLVKDSHFLDLLPTVLGHVIEELRKEKRLKHAEAAHMESEERYRGIVEHLPVLVCRFLPENGIITFANRAFCKYFGRDIDRLIGHSALGLTPEEKRANIKNHLNSLTTENPLQRYELLVEIAGEKRWHRWTNQALFNGQGNLIEYQSIGEDITEQKEAEEALRRSEEHFRSIIENAIDIIAILDSEGIIDYISPSGESLLGYKSVEMCRRNIAGFIHPDDLVSVYQAIDRRLQNPMLQPQTVEFRCLHKDGSWRFVEGVGRGLTDNTSAMRLLVSARDVTQRKQAEREIRRLNEELEERVRERTLELQQSLERLHETQDQLIESEKMAALGELVAGIAHEINTPVGIGVTAASFLEQKTRDFSNIYSSGAMQRSDVDKFVDTASEVSETILTNLRRAADLIKSFKQVAVDQSSEKRRRFNIKAYVEEVLLSLGPKLKRTMHTVSINCPGDPELDSYPGAISQVLTNLVMNSLIHGFDGIEKGEITLDISEQGESLVLCYSDNGMGMDQGGVKRIFDPFFTTRRGHGGTGLGMHMVYNLVTQTLGGRIKCTSLPGKGTQFKIDIPTSQ